MQVPTRISLQSNLGTLRYIGPLPIWPNVDAYGIEWDDATRGKHSGTYDGVEYFQTVVPDSASFIKSTRKLDRKVGFEEAVRSRYAPAELDEIEKTDIVFGKKVAERVGFDKIRIRQSKLDQLSMVSLDGQCVAYPSDNLEQLFPSIQELDLSHNLFDSLADVARIVVQLPRLRIIKLNGNRFVSWELPPDLTGAFSSLSVVSLSFTLIPPSVISRMPEIFPAVQECSLAENKLSGSEITFNQPWPSLQILDLSYSDFSTVPVLVFPDDADMSLSVLNLSHNRILGAGADVMKSVRSLDLRHNQITSWTALDGLRAQFPGVRDLRLQWNPIIQSLDEDDVQAYILGWWGGLTMVNSIKVSEKERMSSELYFMSKVGKGQIKDFDLKGQRWAELCETYGAPIAPEEVKKKSTVLKITFVTSSGEETRRVPRGLTVQRLKLLVAKWYRIPVAKINLVSVFSDGREIALDDSLRELDYYEIDDGSVIRVQG
ncbi:hypothetical protein BZA70DRAFT_275332 [Myxozyma melibiosi]|uniref:CAP-Gly domain-containing protein n=1 Tax=Myxozyma melibiosi TaxID=54550 RepID=A0ABR1FAN5_9ASCO